LRRRHEEDLVAALVHRERLSHDLFGVAVVIVPGVVEEGETFIDGCVHDPDRFGVFFDCADVPATETDDRDFDAGASEGPLRESGGGGGGGLSEDLAGECSRAGNTPRGVAQEITAGRRRRLLDHGDSNSIAANRRIHLGPDVILMNEWVSELTLAPLIERRGRTGFDGIVIVVGRRAGFQAPVKRLENNNCQQHAVCLRCLTSR
jgi:hypothetical protein